MNRLFCLTLIVTCVAIVNLTHTEIGNAQVLRNLHFRPQTLPHAGYWQNPPRYQNPSPWQPRFQQQGQAYGPYTQNSRFGNNWLPRQDSFRAYRPQPYRYPSWQAPDTNLNPNGNMIGVNAIPHYNYPPRR